MCDTSRFVCYFLISWGASGKQLERRLCRLCIPSGSNEQQRWHAPHTHKQSNVEQREQRARTSVLPHCLPKRSYILLAGITTACFPTALLRLASPIKQSEGLWQLLSTRPTTRPNSVVLTIWLQQAEAAAVVRLRQAEAILKLSSS